MPTRSGAAGGDAAPLDGAGPGDAGGVDVGLDGATVSMAEPYQGYNLLQFIAQVR